MESDGANDESRPLTSGQSAVPRYYANMVNVATAPYDVTLTFIDGDGTALPGEFLPELEWRTAGIVPRCQVVMSLGHAKAMIPLIVKGIADYETKFGVIPAPGFDESAKG
jgi:hypothetical protein